MIARRVVVHGRVQGVFFRDATRREAAGHGVRGWVRNRADGAVEAWLEGEEPAVEELLAWMGEGPRSAAVERVESDAAEPEGLDGFEVR